MRASTLALVLALTGSSAGCSGSSDSLPSGSHQGTMVALPDKLGFFEIRTEGSVSKAKGSRAKSVTNSLLVYFYQPDGKTEISPAPTDVMVKVGTGAASSAVALAPQARGGFASSPGHFPSGFRGQLNAKINGEAVETIFVVR